MRVIVRLRQLLYKLNFCHRLRERCYIKQNIGLYIALHIYMDQSIWIYESTVYSTTERFELNQFWFFVMAKVCCSIEMEPRTLSSGQLNHARVLHIYIFTFELCHSSFLLHRAGLYNLLTWLLCIYAGKGSRCGSENGIKWSLSFIHWGLFNYSQHPSHISWINLID